MPQACRDAIKALWHDNILSDCANASLIRDKCLLVDVGEKQLFPKTKKGLYDAMQHALIRAAGPYDAAFKRYVATLGNSGKTGNFRTRGRLVIGLGSESVLETGITLHHTYGTPVIPGSALKGLASHYCDQVRGVTNPGFKRGEVYHNALFGTDEDSGHIIFHDAWLTPGSLASALPRDIMTPHHGDYYAGKSAAPTDFDDPNPVSFLSINGTFYISVSCDCDVDDENGKNETGKKWEDLAFRILSDALREWGIGGKTSAGYGRMIPAGNFSSGNSAPSSGIIIAGKPISGTSAPNNGPRYRKEDPVTATRIADPKGKSRPYFQADDGICGCVESGDVSSVEIGQRVQLKVVGVMLDGQWKYSFAEPGSRKTPPGNPHERDRVRR
ncbi:type III-B CRISPR module RAMP protein Cmr6 [Methanoregula sp.]|jgi:CRISPR type III-B/RAMP module RAMP protein Cmr6|uniref:type III-B CRISPR module RAMP protein Cmr6 n=1 Tax=Methanoregula sp. TaxID=2052170 RepID=UPI003561F4AC